MTEQNPRQVVRQDMRVQGHSLVPKNMNEVIEFGRCMAGSGLAVPPHLRENTGACIAVCIQAIEWGVSPFAAAQQSMVIRQKDGTETIAYQSRIIAAVVQTHPSVKDKLRVEFQGTGDSMKATCTGTLRDEDKPRTIETPPIGAIGVKNSPLWKWDPQQQLAYYAQRSWARREAPWILMGVQDIDEGQVIDVTSHDVDDVPPRPVPPSETRAPVMYQPGTISDRPRDTDPDFEEVPVVEIVEGGNEPLEPSEYDPPSEGTEAPQEEAESTDTMLWLVTPYGEVGEPYILPDEIKDVVVDFRSQMFQAIDKGRLADFVEHNCDNVRMLTEFAQGTGFENMVREMRTELAKAIKVNPQKPPPHKGQNELF